MFDDYASGWAVEGSYPNRAHIMLGCKDPIARRLSGRSELDLCLEDGRDTRDTLLFPVEMTGGTQITPPAMKSLDPCH